MRRLRTTTKHWAYLAPRQLVFDFFNGALLVVDIIQTSLELLLIGVIRITDCCAWVKGEKADLLLLIDVGPGKLSN